MEIIWKTKGFDALSLNELYEILRLREQVFILEQNCAYDDLDYKDQKALHVMGIVKGAIVAYSRIFRAGDCLENASIGRVLVSKDHRGHEFGQELMRRSIAEVHKNFEDKLITISAQCYLIRFYENLGFVVSGAQYLEDDIPHIPMTRDDRFL